MQTAAGTEHAPPTADSADADGDSQQAKPHIEDTQADATTTNTSRLMEEETEFGPSPPASAAAAAVDSDLAQEGSAAAAVIADSGDGAGEAARDGPVRRVKLYLLGVNGAWEDNGTGYLSYVNIRTTRQRTLVRDGREITDPTEPQFGFVVTAETDVTAAAAAAGASSCAAAEAGSSTCATPAEAPVILLNHLLVAGTDYQVQSETIITWCMVDTGADIALSFQDGAVCEETARLIETQKAFLAPPPIEKADDPPAGADADMGLQVGYQGGENGVGGGEDALPHDPFALIHHSESDPARRLYDDYTNAPPISLDTLPRFTQRIISGELRICKREIYELIHIWRQKEEEFQDLLAEERKEYAEEQQREATLAATAPLTSTPESTGAHSTAVAHSTPCSPVFSPICSTLGQMHTIFRCLKALLLTNDVEVLEVLLAADNIMDVIGMLEYDDRYTEHPVRSSAPRDFRTHRAFIAAAEFKHVLDFHDEVVLHKVHQSYLIGYIKDVILAAHLDDATLNTLARLIFVSMIFILSRLAAGKDFIDGLFHALNTYAQVDFAAADSEKERNATLERQKTVLLGEENAELNASLDSLHSDTTQPLEAATSHPSQGLATTQSNAATSQRSSAFAASTPAANPSLRSLLLFLQELVLMAKSVPLPDVRDRFYRTLDQNALFEVLEAILVRDAARLTQERQREHAASSQRAASASAAASVTIPASALAAASTTPSASNSISTVDSGGETPHDWLWLICTDIISNICIHDASLFRTYLISTFRGGAPNMLAMMIGMFGQANLSTSLAHQLSCLIRLVLDPEAMSVQDQHLFLARVYEEHLVKLLDPLAPFQPTTEDEDPFAAAAFSNTTNPLILRKEAEARRLREQRQASFHVAAYHAIELLSYCALHHNASPSERADMDWDSPVDTAGRPTPPTDFFRKFAVAHRVLPRVLLLLRTTRRNDLVCSAIRFFRICLGSRDRSYTQVILSSNLFEPILLHFRHNGARYNLLNSVVCELMHFLNETHRALYKNQPALYNPNSILFLKEINERLWHKYQLDRVQYVKTFQESKAIFTEHEHRQRERRVREEEAELASLPRSMHDEEEHSPGVATRHDNKFIVRSSGSAGRRRERANVEGKITHRRKSPYARAAAAAPAAEVGEQKSSIEPLSATCYGDENGLDQPAGANVPLSSGSGSLPLDAYASDSDDEVSSQGHSFDEVVSPKRENDEEDDALVEHSSTPSRRILFDAEGRDSLRDPARRRSKQSKRKAAEDAHADLASEFPAVASPPHSPLLSKSLTSETPPTAIRSPELNALPCVTLSPTSTSSITSSGPLSPPRQITPLDLAVDADFAAAAAGAIAADAAAAGLSSPLNGHHQPRRQSAPPTSSPALASAPSSPPQATKRRRLEGSM